LEDEDIVIPRPGPNIGLLQAVLAGEVEPFNLSAAIDFGAQPEGWSEPEPWFTYWERRAREGLDSGARAKLEAMIAVG